MVKVKRVLYLIVIVMVIFTSSLASSKFTDIWNTITGRATTQNVAINITVGNSAPNITLITAISEVTPIEDHYVNVSVNFTAIDSDGEGNLKDASSFINITKSGEAVRQNSSCLRAGTNNATSANFTCIVQMWYFDSSGTWNIGAMINDTSNAQAFNTTHTLTYNQLSSFKSSPSTLTFPSVNPGALNTTSSNDPLLMNNTGNKAIAAGSIDLNATHLVGETDNTKALYAGNFTISLAANGGIECGGTTTNVTTLARAVYTAITNSTLSRVNHSVNDGITGQEQLYSCLTLAGSELSSQSYSTSAQGAWTLRIALALFVIHRIKKKGKPKVEIIEREKERVPVTIFTNEVGGLEALCKYLKENRNMKYCEIARMLQRSDRTIWTAYKKAVEKYNVKIHENYNDIYIPYEKLRDRTFTILESVIIYLREMNLKYSEIARLLERDQRNVRTIHARAVRKMSE